MTLPFSLKDITIHPVIEQQGAFFDALGFFPALTKDLLDENRAWLQPAFVDANDRLVLCIQSFVVKTARHKILIDACVGNYKPRPSRPFWNMLNSDRFEKGLAAAGLAVHDIDYVMCTHLHTDHVGWNTRLENGRWVPTFPNATYIMADRELAHWTQREKENPQDVPWITDSVLPIIAAKRAKLVKSDFVFDDQIQFIPTPGHTIDHYSVLVGRPGADVLITGDMIHSPLQGKYPELGMMADYDSAQAGKTRRKVFDRFCEESTIMCATHFPTPSTGHVRRWGDGYKFIAVAD
ncbi:MAG TPA: MBL fold metallo-hydrolase [Xanthobacteraceae bacterium]|nr:MBL fold metallo-hydrolase [Xanthobacteraceae bacterium]